ncbi:MAG: ABC transporter substrate-binding protein [Pseudomonadota bacterium]
MATVTGASGAGETGARWRARARCGLGMMIGAALAAALWTAPAAAADVEAANALVEDTAAQILDLAASEASDLEKRQSFEALLNETADVARIARLTIGRPWRGLTDSQKADYQAALIPFAANRFVKSFGDFKGGSVRYKSSTTTKVRDEERVLVRTIGRRPASAEATDILWVVTELEGRPVFYDVRIENLSLVVQLKNEMSGYLSSVGGDFDKLVALLRESTA